MTPEQLDEIEKLAATWLGKEKDFYATGREAALHQFILAMREHALPLVKALREARESHSSDRAGWDEAAEKMESLMQGLVKSWEEARAEVARLRAERDEARKWLEGICAEFEGAVAHADWRAAGSKGMSVPFTSDFADMTRHPGVISRMRWWAREFRAALKEGDR